ncbi:MAG: hypothetical protein AAF514_12625, partial [Verrucomicrobiota bacterium]
MAVFNYRALRSNGEQVEGEFKLQNKAEVYRRLEKDGLTPITVVSSGSQAEEHEEDDVREQPRLRRAQVIHF